MMFVNNATQEASAQHVNITTSSQHTILLSIEGLRVIQIVNHVVLSGTVCLFGTIANTINMVIFVKQGMKDNVNLSLFAISFSDLCSLITLEWLNMNLNPFMEDADIPFEPVEIQYFTGGWPHACFARITIWITIYVTFERFCCIAFPLKIKEIITPLRTKVVISAIYVLMLFSLAPVYVGMYFGEKFIPGRNQTRVGLIDREYKEQAEFVSFMMYALIESVSFVTLIIFTGLLLIHLQRRSKWRYTSKADPDKPIAASIKDKKTMKLISLIAIILIVCFTPSNMMYVANLFVPELSLTGENANIFHAGWSVAFLAEAINASVSIFLFYKMSSKYRKVFLELFTRPAVCSCKVD